jgi:hypothetical protein
MSLLTHCQRLGRGPKWLQPNQYEKRMANAKQAKARRLNMTERAQQLMDLHFPNVPTPWIWRRLTNDGFTTVPRTLPIVMQAIDAQSKGQPAGHVLFGLWARSPDHPLITIENPGTFAAEAGFVGERAVDTWRRRMKRLRELSFIQTKPGASGEFHYVLLLNPNASVLWMREKGLVQDLLHSRFVERLIEVGAFGEIEAVQAVWKAQRETAQADAVEVIDPERAKKSSAKPRRSEAAPNTRGALNKEVKMVKRRAVGT